MTIPSDLDLLSSMLYTGYQDSADCVCVLCGEDGLDRLNAALGIFSRGAAPTILFTGGLHEPPFRMGAEAMRELFIERGGNPTAVIVDAEAMHTRAQALTIASLCHEHEWKQVVVVASHYHLPRAFLTVLKALQEKGLDEKVRILCAFPRAPWSLPFCGFDVTRADRRSDEARKIEEYQSHVARPSEGIAYLEHWEGVHA